MYSAETLVMVRIFFSIGVIVLVIGCTTVSGPGEWPPASSAENAWTDSTTGHRVIRLSRREGANEVFYFHQNPFTASGDKMAFMGHGEQGRCAFIVDLESLEIRQVTNVNTGFEVVAPKSRILYYMSGDSVFSTHLDTLETREIAKAPPHYKWGRGFSVNADETLLAGCFCLGEEQYYTSSLPRDEWIQAIWEAKLPNALYTINIQTGEINECYQVNEWLGHVQFSPTDPALIEFCHEGPAREVERLWSIRTDGTGLRKLHEKKYAREIQTHEFWSPDGSKVWCDFQTPGLLARLAPKLEALSFSRYYIASVDVNTRELNLYRMRMRHASRHFNISPDQTMFCGDGEGGTFRLCPSGKWIFLYRIEGKNLNVEKLCSMAGHSYGPACEPNVHFTPDGKWVVFQSDMTGTSQVYAVEVAASR